MTCACAIDGDKINYCPLHDAAPELLKACKAQRRAIDILFALLVLRDETFMPSQSGTPWDALLQGNKAIHAAQPPKADPPGWFA